MDVVVAVDPGLGLDAAAFVAGWNGDADHRRLAEARVERQAPAGFPLDPAMVEQGLVILGWAAETLTAALASVAVGELVKELLKRRREGRSVAEPPYVSPTAPEPTITVEAVAQPDGAVLLVVTEEER